MAEHRVVATVPHEHRSVPGFSVAYECAAAEEPWHEGLAWAYALPESVLCSFCGSVFRVEETP